MLPPTLASVHQENAAQFQLGLQRSAGVVPVTASLPRPARQEWHAPQQPARIPAPRATNMVHITSGRFGALHSDAADILAAGSQSQHEHRVDRLMQGFSQDGDSHQPWQWHHQQQRQQQQQQMPPEAAQRQQQQLAGTTRAVQDCPTLANGQSAGSRAIAQLQNSLPNADSLQIHSAARSQHRFADSETPGANSFHGPSTFSQHQLEELQLFIQPR